MTVNQTDSLKGSEACVPLDPNSPIVRDVTETFKVHTQQDLSFARALLGEALELLINGEPDVSRLMLRDVINATIGFEQLSLEIGKPSKSLHRMLSIKGNPTMDNLAAIIGALRHTLKVDALVVSTTAEHSAAPLSEMSTECLQSA